MEDSNHYALLHVRYGFLDDFKSPEMMAFEDNIGKLKVGMEMDLESRKLLFRKKWRNHRDRFQGNNWDWNSGTPFEVKHSGMERTVWHGILSWWSNRFTAMSGFIRMTLFWAFQGRLIKIVGLLFVLEEQIICEKLPYRQKKITNRNRFNLHFTHSTFLLPRSVWSAPLRLLNTKLKNLNSV